MRRLAAALGAALLVAPALAVGASGSATAAASGLTILGAGAGYTTSVYLQVPGDLNAVGVAQKISDVVVGSGSGDSFTLAPTADLRRAETSNLAAVANVDVFRTRGTIQQLTAAVVTRNLLDLSGQKWITIATRSQDQPDQNQCAWVAVGSEFQGTNRIGQMQLSNNLYGEFDYSQQADSTFGVTFDTGSGWSADGTASVTTTLSDGGGLPRKGVFHQDVTSTFFAQKYVREGTCNPVSRAQFVKAEGDVNPGSETSANPYKGNTNGAGYCYNDAAGYITLAAPANGAKGGFWDNDTSHAVTYSGGATLEGIGVSATTGYTKDIRLQFSNDEGDTKEVCGSGNAQPDDSPVLWTSPA